MCSETSPELCLCAAGPNISKQLAKNSLVRNKQDPGVTPEMRSEEKACGSLQPNPGAGEQRLPFKTFLTDSELITNLIHKDQDEF